VPNDTVDEGNQQQHGECLKSEAVKPEEPSLPVIAQTQSLPLFLRHVYLDLLKYLSLTESLILLFIPVVVLYGGQ
jgi:hypothetical protein